MRIPYQQLSNQALQAILEEFVTREGTEYGSVELSLDDKVAQIRRQLSNATVVVEYDPLSESCQLVKLDK
ncbi:MAG: hypothetical protein COC19_06945 [SAR86 cluster bacterium]|uniref:Cytoplasmic protein n=1 Tax=SAR86 cluster bacterium TaxID=2030880 RepID=A0A2A4MIH3_9GAMM|nr:MAG: hypothetical protein COC19_06945 [SAR86 cluster bacterium]